MAWQRQRLLALAAIGCLCGSSAVLGCEDILPIEVARCEGDPPAAECTCSHGGQPPERSGPRAISCAECQGPNPLPDCANAQAGASGTAGSAGTSGGGAAAGGTDAAAAGAGGDGGAPVLDSGDDSGSTSDACAACPPDQPLCSADHECVQCLGYADCSGELDRCAPDTHRCVQCLLDTDCGADAPRCEPAMHVCVQCLANADCDVAAPLCGADRRCAPCTQDEDCEGGDAAHCDTRVGSTRRGECVRCIGHEQCENPTPQCSDGECVPCTADAACTARTGTELCNTLAGAETEGECVHCTSASEAAQCGETACRGSTGTCTEVERGTLTACRACQADSECVDGADCVPHVFDGTSLGSFCFFASGSSGCAEIVPSLRPYSQMLSLTSVDGNQTDYCLPITTCQALEDAVATGVNGGKECALQSDCGATDVNDGYCPESGGAMDQCSYQCDHDYDCPQIGFTRCLGSGADKFCQP